MQINVTNLDATHRRALEDVIGQPLLPNQQLTIHVTPVQADRPQTLEDWTSLYQGLNDQTIEAIDQDLKTRADLTRNLA